MFGFWVGQLLTAHRESARWSISLHYRIASLQGRIAVYWWNLRCKAGSRLTPPVAGGGNHLSALPAGRKRLIGPYVQQQAFRA
jgi:hypothetical protein